MKPSILVAAIMALGLTASAAFAQEAGFGGEPSTSKNQVPGPSVNNPSDPAAGNPGSAAQIPTAPQKQEDLYDGSASVPSGSSSSSSEALRKPNTSNPVR